MTTYEKDFLDIKDQLTSYLYRLSANREDAEDVAQDTFIRAKEKLSQFKGKSSFKTWVFTIATNIARDNQRVRNRWAVGVQDECKNAAQTIPAVEKKIFDTFQTQTSQTFDIKEHINYCFTCIAKNLELEQQLVVILKEVYQFKRNEIAEIIGKTEGVVKHLLFDGRKALQQKYQHRCAMINKNGPCYQCAELNDVLQSSVDGPQNAQEKINALNLDSPDADQSLDTRFSIIRNINPLTGNGAVLEDTILQILRTTINDH